MDWSKLDAGLAAELAEIREQPGRYAVFVHLAPGVVEPERLAELGLDAGGGLIRTATVSSADVDRLSDQPEVRHIALSRSLGLQSRP